MAAEQSHPAVMQGIFRGWHTSEVTKVELRAINAPRVESKLKAAPRDSPTDNCDIISKAERTPLLYYKKWNAIHF